MLEEFNYYPFGLTFEVSHTQSLSGSNTRYNSQSIERNEFTDNANASYGLNWYDFMARSYDMQIGRWMQPDPLMQHASPYLAMSNNPVLFTDPTGLEDLPTLVVRAQWPWWYGRFTSLAQANAALQDAIWEQNFFKVDHTMQTDYDQEQSRGHINYAQNVVNDYRIRDQQNADRAKFSSVVDRPQSNGGNPSKVDYSTDQMAKTLSDKVIESIRESTPKYYGGSGALQLIGGLGLVGGLTKISKASIGLRKVGEASETTLLSSAAFYKLGIRGFAPFKVWTPFGYAKTWETILGRWTAPAGGSLLLYDYIENNNKKK